MGFALLFGYLIIAMLVYGVALLASLIIFAYGDFLAPRNRNSPFSSKISERYKNGPLSRRIFLLIVRVVIVPILIIITAEAVGRFAAGQKQPSFTEVIGEAPPASVHVVRGAASGISALEDTEAWIHFTINSKDLSKIIAHDKYLNSKTGTVSQLDIRQKNTPSWWLPSRIGGNWRLYERDTVNPDDHKSLIVNASGSDVYAYRFLGFN